MQARKPQWGGDQTTFILVGHYKGVMPQSKDISQQFCQRFCLPAT